MTGLAAGEIPEVQGVSIVQRGFHDIGKLGGSRKRGWANQHEEKPVAKLQPTTCVISQIWGDNQQHKFLTKVWMHPRSDHSHHIWKWSESHSSSVDTNVSPGVTKRLHTPTHIQGYWQLRLMGRQTVLKQLDADLNNSITAAGYHQASGWVHVHAADVVFALVERGQRHSTTSPRRENVTINKMWLIWGKKKTLNSLFFFDRLKAGVAHPHGELEAHDGVRGAFGTAFSTNGLSALPAVVLQKHRCAVTHEEGSLTDAGWAVPYLSEAQGLTVPHLLDVPEERLLALLTRVTV